MLFKVEISISRDQETKRSRGRTGCRNLKYRYIIVYTCVPHIAQQRDKSNPVGLIQRCQRWESNGSLWRARRELSLVKTRESRVNQRRRENGGRDFANSWPARNFAVRSASLFLSMPFLYGQRRRRNVMAGQLRRRTLIYDVCRSLQLLPRKIRAAGESVTN